MFSRNSKDHRFWTSSSGSRDRATPSTDIFPIKKELEERGRRRDGQIWDCIQAREHRNTLLLLVTRRDANWTDNNPSSNRPVLGVSELDNRQKHGGFAYPGATSFLEGEGMGRRKMYCKGRKLSVTFRSVRFSTPLELLYRLSSPTRL